MLGTLLKWFGGEGSKSAKGKSKNAAPESGEIPARLNRLYAGDRGIYDLHSNSAELRLWLPVPLKTAMDESTAVMGVTGAKYLREFFVVHLYGAHELLRMKAEKTGLYYVPPPVTRPEQVMFSRAATVDCIPGLGKNIMGIKVKIPQKIKDDLDFLANRHGASSTPNNESACASRFPHPILPPSGEGENESLRDFNGNCAGVPLSRYTRELLASHFLGHTVWPERIVFWSQDEEKNAIDWENGITDSETICLDDWSKEKATSRATFSEIETVEG